MLLASQTPVEYSPPLCNFRAKIRQSPQFLRKLLTKAFSGASVQTQPILDLYDFKEALGIGAFAVVKRAVHKKSKKEYAVKIIDRSQDHSVLFKSALETELKITKIRHTHIVEFYDVFEDESNVYVVMELLTGGSLMDFITKRIKLGENEAKQIVQQVLEGTELLHKKGIVHRDLKPQNLIFSKNQIIKIVDFGLSKIIAEDDQFDAGGTIQYTSPELLAERNPSKEDVFKCDVWSIGVITYLLLCGYEPFPNSPLTTFKIKNGLFTFASPHWDHVSESAKDFIVLLLTVEPSLRPSVSQCLLHPWLSS